MSSLARDFVYSSIILLYVNFKSQRFVSNPFGFRFLYNIMYSHMRDNFGENLLIIIQNVKDTFTLLTYDMIKK